MEINAAYNVLAEAVLDSLGSDTDWKVGILLIAIGKGSVAFQSWKIDGNGKVVDVETKAGYIAMKAARIIHEKTSDMGGSKWNRAKYQLTRDGKFGMELVWDQLLEDGVDDYRWNLA